ncbi:MAG: hypothetical protein M9916_10130 [Crocinitomicaceae bacterium]|nr:hypothetical protein [Crocinitomicaceae bacterium]
MAHTVKTVQIIVLTYLLFGLFNLFQHHYFLVPVTYSELFVFALILIPFFQNWKQKERFHWSIVAFSAISMLIHPFFWEIALNSTEQQAIFSSIVFDGLKIIQWVLLAVFFFFVSYDRDKNVIKLEWLVPSIMTIGCLFNPPLWYISLVFIISGLSALYSIKRRMIVGEYIFPVLIGIGMIHFINFFYWV